MKTDQPQDAERSVPDLLHQLSDQTSLLMRQEFALLRTEITQNGKIAGQSATFFAASSLFGIGAFGALTLMLVALLSYAVAVWVATLIVAVVYGIVAAAAASAGKARLKQIRTAAPSQTIESIREDVAAARQGAERGR